MGIVRIFVKTTGKRFITMRKKIRQKDIMVTVHPVDGFTLSYRTDDDRYFKQRYIFHSLRAAKSLFTGYVNRELNK